MQCDIVRENMYRMCYHCDDKRGESTAIASNPRDLQVWFDERATYNACMHMSEDFARDVWTCAILGGVRMRAIHALAICQRMDAWPARAFVRAKCMVYGVDVMFSRALAFYFDDAQARKHCSNIMYALQDEPNMLGECLFAQHRLALYGAYEVYDVRCSRRLRELRADCFAAFARGLTIAESPVSIIDAAVVRRIARETLNLVEEHPWI